MIIYVYKEGAKNTEYFVFGVPPSQIPSFIQRAKEGDYYASVALVYTFNRKEKYDPHLFSDWMWYTMSLEGGHRPLFMALLNHEDVPCPTYSKEDMKKHIKIWSIEENEESLLDLIPYFETKYKRADFNKSVASFEKKCL